MPNPLMHQVETSMGKIVRAKPRGLMIVLVKWRRQEPAALLRGVGRARL